MTSVHTKQEALLDELLKDYTDPRDILGEHGLLKQLLHVGAHRSASLYNTFSETPTVSCWSRPLWRPLMRLALSLHLTFSEWV